MSRRGPDPDNLDEDEAEYGDAAGLRQPPRRKDASMTLLTSMLERPLDPGYAAAAQQREARGEPAATSRRGLFLLVSVVVIGLIIGVSTADLRDRDGARTEARGDLIEQIEQRQSEVDDRSERARDLQADIDAATGRIDPGLVGGDQKDLDGVRVSSGLVEVGGPGLQVTLDDAGATDGGSADGDPRTGTSDENRVQSRDLQIITNGLWEAGAEAIAINGQRLTSRSAIRFAGEAILVNFRPLTRPYTIEAIGDPQQMRRGFASGEAGSYLQNLRSTYDIQSSMTARAELELPSAINAGARRAEVVPSGDTPPTPVPLKKENP